MSETADAAIIAGAARWLSERGADPIQAARNQLAGEGVILDLEQTLRQIHGYRYALAVNNATNGLLLLALNLPWPTAGVLCGPTSWPGTWRPFALAGHAVLHVSAGPRGAIRLPQSFSPDFRVLITTDSSAATNRFASRHGLWHIIDAAAADPRQPLSVSADAVVLSFGPGKKVDAGEGGAILMNDFGIYKRLLAFGQHPRRMTRDVSLAEADDNQPINTRIHPLAALIADVLLRSV